VPPTVFISYSHEDEVWKDRLVKHLAGLERDGRLRIWNDRDIRAGQTWLREIETAMGEARVAVLLVSPDFLASEFIQTCEVPALLARQGVHIVPVIVKDCLWEEEVHVSNLQARPRDGRALASYRPAQRDTELKRIAKEVLDLLGNEAPPRPAPATKVEPPSGGGESDGPVQIFQTGQILDPEEGAPSTGSDFGPNPYKGLAAFREEDSDRFFGRERLTDELWGKVRKIREAEGAVRLVAVLGPSGSGKSSLVRAGLLPELARHPLTGLENPRVAIVTPGAHPVDALSLVLARLITGDSDPVAKARELSEELNQRNRSGEMDGLRRIAGDRPLLVFVDQFEEIYTLASAMEREVFVDNLLAAAADCGGSVTALLGLRNDFLSHTRHNERLHEVVTSQNLFVRYLREDELRRAIAEPARRAGHPLADGTVELLVQETRDEEQALPPLQFTLSRIWEGMSNGIPPAQTYREIGGVAGSLAQEAQRLYDELPRPNNGSPAAPSYE
jgi:hypothetical protein